MYVPDEKCELDCFIKLHDFNVQINFSMIIFIVCEIVMGDPSLFVILINFVYYKYKHLQSLSSNMYEYIPRILIFNYLVMHWNLKLRSMSLDKNL